MFFKRFFIYDLIILNIFCSGVLIVLFCAKFILINRKKQKITIISFPILQARVNPVKLGETII